MKLLGTVGVIRWVLRLLLLPVFLLREIWRRVLAGSGNERMIRQAVYAGGPVAVVAIYQEDRVRPDVLSLLLALRRRGVYTIVVNTGSLHDAGARLPADCYVERINYGRDFASYQAGIRITHQIAPNADRLMLLNDSVFYIADGLDRFLQRLLFSFADVCSATESNEVLPHQTSFCMSFSGKCAQDQAFRRFWRRYVATDLRPMTVLFGEIALSQVLNRASMSQETLASRRSVARRLLDQHYVDGFKEAQLEQQVGKNLTHCVPLTLLDLGLPLIKLDLPHRAGKSESELQSILGQLAPMDSQSLGELWLSQSEKKGKSNKLDQLGALSGLA